MVKTKITDNTYFWIVVVVVIALVLIGMVLYLVKALSDNTYYNYQGKSGNYEITKSKVSDIIFYSISVFSDNTKYIYSFRNHPKDLEDVYLDPNLDSKMNRPGGLKIIYITRDVELYNETNRDSLIAAANFEQVLGGTEGIFKMNMTNTYTTFFRNDLPVITCSNVTDTTAVIYLKLGEESKVYTEGDCVVIQGRGGSGLIRAAEKFAYYLLGVF